MGTGTVESAVDKGQVILRGVQRHQSLDLRGVSLAHVRGVFAVAVGVGDAVADKEDAAAGVENRFLFLFRLGGVNQLNR